MKKEKMTNLWLQGLLMAAVIAAAVQMPGEALARAPAVRTVC